MVDKRRHKRVKVKLNLVVSSYFDQMYESAVKLIKKGKAYVSDLSAEKIREYRGTLTEPGKEGIIEGFGVSYGKPYPDFESFRKKCWDSLMLI